MKTPFNKFLYVGFLTLGLYQAVLICDDSNGTFRGVRTYY